MKSINLDAQSAIRLMSVALGLIPFTAIYYSNIHYIQSDYLPYSLLGVIGAIFANSTGAGGGVVFIPFFNQIGLSEEQAVSTSIGIQCFGMTAGALTWCLFYRSERVSNMKWKAFIPTCIISSICSTIGLAFSFIFSLSPPASLHQLFSYFSIILGLCILVVVFIPKGKVRTELQKLDYIILAIASILGGVITAWLSVGIGEIIATVLILRCFDTKFAIAAAVVVSAVSIWVASIKLLWLEPNAYLQIVLLAGPGAILGGIMAKKLALLFNERYLKAFLACWILIIGIYG
ncbi:sulfite exporter TauE/SafE family protein [Aliikangiella sp. G2MR2-5]|uniref:sulfite exporter TauE/SafE family protein n=1 Tax=Aliikangiella sp. G2MR2-5 TaxID=2788943 RepID=UPI0018AB04C4|nr:sulfite exporter TauE/SafE family protein [Aliikangiella sp. G2MR2-5]